MEYFFVYGSLLTSSAHPLHNYLRSVADFLGPASVGGIVVDLEGVPALMLSGLPEDSVNGELYKIHEGESDALFEVLDIHVGCSEDIPEPHDLFRHRVKVTLKADQERHIAWLYLLND